MKKACFLSVYLLILGVSFVVNAGTRGIPGSTSGRYYNSVWKKWYTEPIALYVDNEESLYIKGGDGVLSSVCVIKPNNKERLIDTLKMGFDFIGRAKKEKIEITKEYGYFWREGYDDYLSVKLTFFSRNKGQDSNIILEIFDFKVPYKSITLYLNSSQISGLIKLIEKAPSAIKILQENEEKARELQ